MWESVWYKKVQVIFFFWVSCLWLLRSDIVPWSDWLAPSLIPVCLKFTSDLIVTSCFYHNQSIDFCDTDSFTSKHPCGSYYSQVPFLPIQGYSQQAQSHRNAIYWVVWAIWVGVFYLYAPQKKSISHFLWSSQAREMNWVSSSVCQVYEVIRSFVTDIFQQLLESPVWFLEWDKWFVWSACVFSLLLVWCLGPLWGFWQHFRSNSVGVCSWWIMPVVN